MITRFGHVFQLFVPDSLFLNGFIESTRLWEITFKWILLLFRHFFSVNLFWTPQVTRDYDEEEQGYDSEKGEEPEDEERKSDSDSPSSAKAMDIDEAQAPKKSKLNGDDHHQDDMEMSD